MSNHLYWKLQAEVNNYAKCNSLGVMWSATKKKSELAIKNGEVKNNGVLFISVVADGVRSKWNYKSN